MVVGKGGRRRRREENNATSFPPSLLLFGLRTRGHHPAGNLGTLDVLYGCCSSCSLVPAGSQQSLLHHSRKRGTIHTPTPLHASKKHPYCFSFLPLSWYKRLRQEVKSGMCVQSVESPGDSEVYALLFLLKLCLGPINWDRKRWDRVETLWISCFAMQILGYNTDLLCLLHGHS